MPPPWLAEYTSTYPAFILMAHTNLTANKRTTVARLSPTENPALTANLTGDGCYTTNNAIRIGYRISRPTTGCDTGQRLPVVDHSGKRLEQDSDNSNSPAEVASRGALAK